MGRFGPDRKREAYELLTQISMTRSMPKRIELTRALPNEVRQLLYIALFEPNYFEGLNYDWDNVKVNSAPYGQNWQTFYKAWPVCRYLGRTSNWSQSRKTAKAYQLLDSIHADEANLMHDVFSGRFKMKYITKKLYNEAYMQPETEEK